MVQIVQEKAEGSNALQLEADNQSDSEDALTDYHEVINRDIYGKMFLAQN